MAIRLAGIRDAKTGGLVTGTELDKRVEAALIVEDALLEEAARADPPDGWELELRILTKAGPDVPSGLVHAALWARARMKNLDMVADRMAIAGVPA